MNYAAALKMASEEAEVVVAEGVNKCPQQKSGLIVLVYRADNKKALADAKVTVAVGESAGTDKDTDKHGLARFLPLDPDDYRIRATPRRTFKMFRSVDPSDQTVGDANCPVHAIKIPVWARPRVKVLWQSDKKAASNVKVEIKKGDDFTHTFALTSGDDGTKWADDDPLKPGTYGYTVTFPSGAECFVVRSKGKPQPVRQLKITGGRVVYTVWIKKSWLKMRMIGVAGGKRHALDNAELRIKWPEDDSEKAFPAALDGKKAFAKADDVAVLTDPATCEVLSVQVAEKNVGEPEVYEFVELTSE